MNREKAQIFSPQQIYWFLASKVKCFLASAIASSSAKVRDKASTLSDHLLLFLENYRMKPSKSAKGINNLKFYSIGNLFWGSELILSKKKIDDY